MSEEVITEAKNGKQRSIQPLNGEFAKWLERQFRGGEKPQVIDAYPLYRGRDQEMRCYHHDVKEDEVIKAERAVELSNEIFSDCQTNCDGLPRNALSKEGTKSYQVIVIDNRRGGTTAPVGTYLLNLEPRIHKPAPEPDEEEDLNSEDGDALTARKMILEVHKDNTGRQERAQAGTLAVVGETMLLLKESLKDSFVQNRELHQSQLTMMGKFQEMIETLGRKSVEEKAVAIDAANAEVDREARRAQMAKENMWTNVMQAGMLESVKVLGALFPGFGHLFSAILTGKPIPPPPQLPANGTATNGTANGVAPTSQPQLPPASPDEKALIDRFIDAVEKTKFDNNSTYAEKLFGKDEANGKPIEPGVFRRDQVGILLGVHMGSLPIDALDVLLTDSGKPEAVDGMQMVKAAAYLTHEMIADITKVFELRKAARK